MKYLNLGCGSRYHPDWINIDIVSSGPGVIAHDISESIPLPDNSCDVVYHSNLLEHLRRADARRFMRECYRVLKPKGILRVAVPDLERICRLYLEKLEAASQEDLQAAHDYDWMMLELYDQTTREQSGGEMFTYLKQSPIPNQEFVFERIGEEGRGIIERLYSDKGSAVISAPRVGVRGVLRRLRRMLSVSRNRMRTVYLGPESSRALGIGQFRLQGEVHQWMYDRYSLGRLMRECAFEYPVSMEAAQSGILNWSEFHLDTSADGTANKPDSFFMEANKPS